MVKRGIWTREQYEQLGQERRFSGAHVAYNLLAVDQPPTPAQVKAFEDISFTLRTGNGTFRTTFRNRFRDVDAKALEWIRGDYDPQAELRIEDRAVSSALTSWEWAEPLLAACPRARLTASDILLQFLELKLPTGETFIVEPDGEPLQYINPPYVVGLRQPESWRYPINRWVAARARRRFADLNLPPGWMQGTGGYPVREISCVHPEAVAFSRREPRFQIVRMSVFERTGSCHVIRTMNILNRSYFSDEQLRGATAAIFASLLPGGLWILGRTLEEDFTNHVSFLRRGAERFELLERIGGGSEIEALALATP
jgi:hypothetical protein